MPLCLFPITLDCTKYQNKYDMFAKYSKWSKLASPFLYHIYKIREVNSLSTSRNSVLKSDMVDFQHILWHITNNSTLIIFHSWWRPAAGADFEWIGSSITRLLVSYGTPSDARPSAAMAWTCQVRQIQDYVYGRREYKGTLCILYSRISSHALKRCRWLILALDKNDYILVYVVNIIPADDDLATQWPRHQNGFNFPTWWLNALQRDAPQLSCSDTCQMSNIKAETAIVVSDKGHLSNIKMLFNV